MAQTGGLPELSAALQALQARVGALEAKLGLVGAEVESLRETDEISGWRRWREARDGVTGTPKPGSP